MALEAMPESTVKGLTTFLSLTVSLPCFALKLLNLSRSVSSCFSRSSGVFSCLSRACSDSVRLVVSMYLSSAFAHSSSKACVLDRFGFRLLLLRLDSNARS
jgi:hypothetical protein